MGLSPTVVRALKLHHIAKMFAVIIIIIFPPKCKLQKKKNDSGNALQGESLGAWILT